MDEIQNIQLPEAAQSEDTRSESIDYEEDTSILDNSYTIPLKNGSPTISTNEKTDGEKLVQTTDNLLNLNSPKTTLLGKLKAKQRLQAFLLPKQNTFINSPIKKAEEISTKNDKNFRKTKQSPMEKAKSIIEELEEIKKVEIKKVEIAKLVSPTLFKERKSSYREKQYRRKSRSRSVELTRKIIDKTKYPDNWEELKARQLTFEDVRDIQLSKASKSTKPHENYYDFRKQLLFETPSQCLNSLKFKGVNGQEKVVPSQSIRYTKNSPTISYSVNPIKYCNGCLSAEEVNGFLPKSHIDILKKFRTNKLEKFPEDSTNRTTQKWYPKQQLNNITEGCEILEKSLSLSILQNYMDEEEDEENKQEKGIASDVPETSTENAVDVDDKAEERYQIESEPNLDISDTITNEANDTAEMQVEKTDVTEAKNDNEIVLDLDASKMKAKDKSGKIKHKKGKKGKRDSRKRKRKKDKIDEKDNGNKKKKKGKNKGDKKIINSDQKKESKSKKKDVGKVDKKVDVDNRRKSSKESKKDKETIRDEKKEEKVLDKIETKINDDREEIKRDSRRESRKGDHKKEAKVFERRYDKKDDWKDDRKDSKKTDKKEDKCIDKRAYKYYDQREDRKDTVKDNKEGHDKKEYDKKEPDKKEHDKKEHDKKEHDKKELDKREHDKKEHDKKEYDKREHDKKDEKTRKIEKDKELTAKVQLYFDEFESISCRSLSKEKAVILKDDRARSRNASRESKTKEESKMSSKSSSGKEKKSKDTDNKETVEDPDTKNKKKDKFKDDNFKIEPLHPEEDLATPDTDEYHSHWESDEDVSNVITYSPLIQGKINTSWESDEEEPVSSPDKVDHYVDQSSRMSSDRTDRRSKKFNEGERSLEMPLNILNVNRKDSRRAGKPTEFPDRKFLNNDMRMMYSEDSWERGEYLKICNDIEDEKLRHERKTLSEERRILEWEKRKIAEKLEKKSLDMLDDFNDGIDKEVTYERIYSENEDVYLKSTEYIDEKKKKKRRKESDYDSKKTSDSASRKRKHSHDEDRRKRHITDDRKKYKSSSKKSRHDKLENYDVKRESYKDDMIKIESEDEFSPTIDKKDETAIATKDNYKSSERLSSAAPTNKTATKRKTSSRWSSSEKPEKPIDKIVSELPVDSLMMSDISDLNSTCDSLLTADVKAANKSDILENEYEEFLKAVTSDISNSGSVSKERKKPPLKKRKEVKKAKRKRRRKYSTSSSSSSSSSSSDSDSSSSSSSSSSYSSSSSSSTSSYDRKKKKRKMKLKAKAKTKSKKQQKEVLDKDKIVKIEMTHSIVKDLDDLQPFPIAKMPTIEIKKEQEDPGYSTMPVVPPVTRELVPLPVPSPSIVPPPQLNLMSIKQEKPDHSVTSKADSTTSPVKKAPLIPTKFIAPIPRKDVPVSTSSNLSVGLDASKKSESVSAKTSPSAAVPSAKAVKNPVSFSMPFKPLVLNETVNDSDSQDFTENFVKKTENIEMKQVEEVKVDDVKIDDKEKLELSVDSTKTEKETVEEKADQIPTTKVEVTVANTEPISPSSNLSDMKELEVVPSSPYRKSSPIKVKIPSPVRRNPSPRKRSASPRDWRRSSLSDSSKRSPLRSVSPKYRHTSPRRDSITRRRSRDRSPLHRRDGRKYDRSSSKGMSPRRRTLFDKQDRRRKPPSPKREKNYSSRSRGGSISPKRQRSISPMNKTPMFRNRRSPSPRSRRSVSPGIRRSVSPGKRRSVSPRGYRSPFRNHSPNSRSSPQSKNRRRSYSRSVSVERKKETIQQTLQRLAGIDDRYHQPTNKSPINSPIEGFKRSVADSTISDDQLLQQNSIESADSPAYRTPSARLVHSPSSPKRVPLDIRINQVLGLDKQTSKALTMNYAQQTTYTQGYTYDQYTEQYGSFAQHGPQQNVLQNKLAYVPPPPPPVPKPTHVALSKVVQIGNVLQVVPTEEIPPQETPKQAPSQKIVQVGNMLQIVPTPTSHVPKVEVIVPPPSIPIQAKAPVAVPQPSLTSQVQLPPPPIPAEKKSLATTIPEKVSAEELMLQKIAERRAERTKRHEERERKRNEKDKRRKEKEKKKQLKLKMRTESMIKKALRIETEALAMGESIDDNDESVMDTTPTCWPSMSLASSGQLLKPAGKGILVAQGVSKINVVCDEQRKCVKFADGVIPGEGTSPSGGEELSSPPPPKEKQFKKIKKKKLHKKKKIKVKIIRKSSTDSPDDEELDNLPPPSPPPGSPPPHVFPARIKTHTINNIHPTYAASVPLMSVGNYAPQYRPNVPMSIPPPIHNLPHVSHHGLSGGRAPPQILSQHGPPMHGSMSHGVPSGLAHGMSSHSHGPIHHSSGPRL